MLGGDPSGIPLREFAHQPAVGSAKILNMSPGRLEIFCSDFLKSEWKAVEVTHVGATRRGCDGGVDYIMIKSQKLYLVQIKHLRSSGRKIGVKWIRELNGAILRDQTSGGIFVTSGSGYTRAAYKEVETAKRNNPHYEFHFLDRLNLEHWISHTNHPDPRLTYMKPKSSGESTLRHLYKQKGINPSRVLPFGDDCRGNILVFR